MQQPTRSVAPKLTTDDMNRLTETYREAWLRGRPEDHSHSRLWTSERGHAVAATILRPLRPRFVTSVHLATVWCWTTAMAEVGDRLPETLRSFVSPNTVFYHAVTLGPSDLLEDVYEMKDHYLQTKRFWPAQGPHVCAVLPCWAAGTALHLNGMHYCDAHQGLALIHALRLFASKDARDVCVMWNVLALKPTCWDIRMALHSSKGL